MTAQIIITPVKARNGACDIAIVQTPQDQKGTYYPVSDIPEVLSNLLKP